MLLVYTLCMCIIILSLFHLYADDCFQKYELYRKDRFLREEFLKTQVQKFEQSAILDQISIILCRVYSHIQRLTVWLMVSCQETSHSNPQPHLKVFLETMTQW